jgi:hypothetical protein
MVEVIGDTEDVVVQSDTIRSYPDGLQTSGTLQVSGEVNVGIDGASFLGESAASSSPGIDEIVVAQGVID